MFSNKYLANDVSAIIVLPATFLFSLPLTKRLYIDDEAVNPSLQQNSSNGLYLYGRFPIASIVGECDVSLLEATITGSFSDFITHENNFRQYERTLSYPKIKEVVPSFDPVHERYHVLNGDETKLIDAYLSQ